MADADNVPGLLIDNNDATNDTAGIQIEMISGEGIPLVVTPTAGAPATTAEGGIYANSTDNNLYYYDGSSWVDLTNQGSSYWSKSGTDLSPATSGDDILLNANETLTISDLTQGSVIFAGASGLISQDNSNLYWDDTNNRLGIGTTAPDFALDVTGHIMAKETDDTSYSAVHSGVDKIGGSPSLDLLMHGEN